MKGKKLDPFQGEQLMIRYQSDYVEESEIEIVKNIHEIEVPPRIVVQDVPQPINVPTIQLSTLHTINVPPVQYIPTPIISAPVVATTENPSTVPAMVIAPPVSRTISLSLTNKSNKNN
jgi:hypothetical protein